MRPEKLNEKVRQYEQFLNDVLKEDLRKVNIQRAKLQHEIKEYDELEANLKLLQQVCCASQPCTTQACSKLCSGLCEQLYAHGHTQQSAKLLLWRSLC